MKTYKFRITESQKIKLDRDIVKFNKLADKLSCTHAVLTASEAFLATHPHHKINNVVDVTWHVPQVKFLDCELTGGFVVAGDYTFIGSIHYSRSDDEISMVSLDGAGIPKEYEQSLPVCNHCNTKRKRNVTFLMKSNIDGTIMQVGSTCLKDFLGYDVSDLMKALKFTMKFADVNSNYLHTVATTRQIHVPQYGVREILMLTNAVIRVFGWAGKKSETHIPTSDIVKQICDTPESFEAEYWLKKVSEAQKDSTDQNMASEVIKWATDVANDPRGSEYMYSVRSCINGGTVTTAQFGILCSAANSFRANVQKKIEAHADTSNVYLGNVGDRLELEVKCIDTRTFSGYYGSTTMYKMVDTENHSLVWFSSSDLEIPNDRFMKIKGTVKKHEEYNHAKQTTLTRVSKVK